MMHVFIHSNRLIIYVISFVRGIKKCINRPYRKYQLKRYIKQCKANDAVIFFFPDYRRHNPHQILLGDAMPPQYHYYAGTIEDALYFQRKASNAVTTYFHLHWPDPILFPAVFKQFIRRLTLFQERGGKCIWSIHNIFPHGGRTPLTSDMHRTLAACVDRLHLFTDEAVEPVLAHYGVAAEKCMIAMRGHYIDSYKNNGDKSEARRILNLPQDQPIIGFFGQLRPYKGLDKLLAAFGALYKTQPAIHLTISGRCPPADSAAMAPWLAKAKEMPNVHLFSDFISDDQVQYHLNAADILVLPYADITNSGSYLLGLSFGGCVVAPHIGSIANLANSGVDTITYVPEEADGLKHALEYALSLSPQQRTAMGAKAFALAQSLSWNDTAQLLCQSFSGLKS